MRNAHSALYALRITVRQVLRLRSMCSDVHGTADQVLPVREGRATRDFLNTLGVTFDYREYPMAHQISDASLDDIDSWLSAQLDRTA